jgi:hypothetical protein
MRNFFRVTFPPRPPLPPEILYPTLAEAQRFWGAAYIAAMECNFRHHGFDTRPSDLDKIATEYADAACAGWLKRWVPKVEKGDEA